MVYFEHIAMVCIIGYILYELGIFRNGTLWANTKPRPRLSPVSKKTNGAGKRAKHKRSKRDRKEYFNRNKNNSELNSLERSNPISKNVSRSNHELGFPFDMYNYWSNDGDHALVNMSIPINNGPDYAGDSCFLDDSEKPMSTDVFSENNVPDKNNARPTSEYSNSDVNKDVWCKVLGKNERKTLSKKSRGRNIVKCKVEKTLKPVRRKSSNVRHVEASSVTDSSGYGRPDIPGTSVDLEKQKQLVSRGEFQMEANKITRFIERGLDAIKQGDTASAKQYVLQAIVGANNEKERFMTGLEVSVSEQKLAEWFGGCSFILSQIGDYYPAQKYFYTAIVFDPEWKIETHAAVSQVVWDELVYFKTPAELQLNLQNILRSLAELDTLAKLAETRKKWMICVAIDGDINKIYQYLKIFGFISNDIISFYGRKAAMWRTARCFLKLGLHEDVRRTCSAILRCVCAYDDSEAFEIWAQSLFATKDYDLALDKCRLALKYCQDGGDRQRLECFYHNIEEQKPPSKKRELDEAWLEGTNADANALAAAAAAAERHKPNPEKRKKRHRRSHRNRSQQNSPIQMSFNENDRKMRSRSLTPENENCTIYRRTKSQNKLALDSVRRLQQENVKGVRSRNLSSCSTATTMTDMSSVGTEISYEDVEISESDSNEENEEDYTSARAASPDFIPNEDLEDDIMQENFYEQSQRFYVHNDEGSYFPGSAEMDGKHLKEGIRLNKSFMHQFEDRRPELLQREAFYTSFLSKDELRQKMLQNPKKYVKCVIQIEGAHDAYCTPVEANVNFNVIEISGRSKIGQAFNDDEVVVEILDKEDARDKRFGQVLGIWERHRHSGTDHPVFICTLDTIDIHLVRPLCKTIPKIHVLDREIKQKFQTKKRMRYKIEVYDYDERSETLDNPKIMFINPAKMRSYIFLVALITWGERHVYPKGAIIKILNSGTSLSTGMSVLNLQHEVPSLYGKETVEQVATILDRTRDEVPTEFFEGRMNLTSLNTFTIDPPGSKDLDDALSIIQIEDGYKVGVHIADVSTFISKDSPIDIEARSRATTFYSGVRNPRNMIPEPLSANRLSLLPNKTRLTISVFFYLCKDGKFKQMEGSTVEIHKTFIQTYRQLTYGEAQQMIQSAPNENDDQVAKDVRSLFRLAHKIRKRRLGNAMFAITSDWEESDEAESESVEAHYLIEEFMILANMKVAEKLMRVYKDVVPIRCQPPPSQEHLEGFLKRNNNYIDILVQFQDKKIGSTTRNFDACLSGQSTKSVVVSRSVWETIKSKPKQASKYLRQDDIHPLQVAVYQHWLSIQERAGYRCSGSLTGSEDGKHYSLNMFPYTHFTSPIRRYNDLIVHRLIHAALNRKHSPYQKEEVDSICIHSNSIMKRAKDFERHCRSLQQAVNFKTNPKMITCTVDEVTDKGLTMCSPLLKYVMKNDRELSFNLLDMGSKPEVFEDGETNWSNVKAVWRKRLYDFHYKPTYRPDIGRELKLNPNKGNVFIPLHEWARMVKCAVEGREQDLSRAIKNAKVELRAQGLNDVSTESLDPLQIQPSTKFSMIYSRGHTVHVQMSAATEKGVIVPKPILYSLTNNVKFCLQHMADPVGCLTHYATNPTCDSYKSVKQYLVRWIPLLSMEAATQVIHNEESCCINSVQVKFSSERRGKFALGMAECEIRNIEFSGTTSDDEDDDDDDSEFGSSYDWLCLKTTVSSNEKGIKLLNVKKPLDSAWIGHARVIKVKKNKDARPSGKITVSFELHDDASIPVPNSTDQKFSVEILRKSEVDRRTESYIKTLPSMADSLACKIALNQPIPELDKKYKHTASLIERDLTYDADKEDPDRRPLPPNNEKQQEAINKALRSRFSLIQGPPGTGKTYTGIKLLYLFDQINRIRHKEGSPSKQVLFCGPSNKSVDLVAEWMLYRMGKFRPNFVRVYGTSIEAQDFPIPGRTFITKKSNKNLKTNPVLYPVALHHLIRKKGNKYAEEIKSYDKLFKANNYQPMPDKVKYYVHIIREASIQEIRNYDIILCTTAVGSNPKVLKATSVHQVIVDEAGMCPEPLCLVPIIATKPEQVVLIGDHKQLRPIILSKEAALLGYETSLFERYASTESSKNVQFTMLEEQYRMHPEICSFPSRQFYEKSLITRKGPWWGSSLRIWPRNRSYKDPNIYITYPHVLVHVEGEEKILTVSTEDGNEQSRSNLAEIDHVIKVYKYIAMEATGSVQILSQYNAQCSEMKRKLTEEGFPDVNVSTVVSSQGGEWDYVIFSTVRSLPDYKIESNPTIGWCKHNLGFITDENQVNVALTRARKGLIIIGNKNLLTCDFVWRKLISDYEKNGCIKSKEEFPPRITTTRLQRMERNIYQSEQRYGDSMFRKGTATSYEGNFDEEEWEPAHRRHRRYRHES